ncbi:MAG: bifunctional aminotransferase class I/II-fold pyridoxal phosphate-dependent enzyme/GNAT family N-acetyltransferase, partial [Flavobacteriales bacterium]|nr:bifunctional aminotransferase class I/II-fold pyridoxal phosphate-dependent enzyme/GNAT family N-acetyltransferase [Flavobacteriales bacterium]
MAQINHNNIVDTINDIALQARQREISHLTFGGKIWDGRFLFIDGKEMLNFGTCGYLALESHPSLNENARDFVSAYGTQYSISRAYATAQTNLELEDKLSQIFDGRENLVFSSTTIAHISVLPIVIKPTDAIIMDQQAHVSMQTAAQLVSSKGVPVEVVRHSNLEMIERKIQSLRNRHDKIWYIMDGVYSMYGDIAPLDELNKLAEKYPSLHFYVDDAHGMSWCGTNGCGAVFDTFKHNNKTLLVSTMAKGFGSVGGIVIFPNSESFEEVRLHGGALAYSHPIVPAVIGASYASALIHLSPEIKDLQNELQKKIQYCNKLLAKTDIPVLSDPKTPIYFLGTGQPNVGYNMNKRILDEGFYVNIGLFPAVSVKNTGLRFTLTNHHTYDDIKAFVDALAYHYPKALEEEGKTVNDVRKAFRMEPLGEVAKPSKKENSKLELRLFNSISDVDKKLWRSCFPDPGNSTWDALYYLEKAFQGNELIEDNWKFYYLFVMNGDEVVAATYLTSGIMKDDLVSPAEVSVSIEKEREKDKYHLCSKTLMMGSLCTEGEHLYVDRKHPKWREAIIEMVGKLFDIQDEDDLNSLILRDFDKSDSRIKRLFNELGFFQMDMPNSNTISGLQKTRQRDYLSLLSAKARRNIRYEVLKYENEFKFEVKKTLSDDDLKRIYQLYRNVGERNYSINIFPYPYSFYEMARECANWEFVLLKDLKNEILGAILCYKDGTTYAPVVIGMDYDYKTESSIYKQIMYRTVVSARNRGFDKVLFGFSADTEKRKLGAVQNEKVAFVNVIDQFNIEKM